MSATLQRIRAAALDTIVAALRESFCVQRCTLRLDTAGELFPVIHESIVEPAHSLIGDRSVALPGQPVVEALLAGADQVIQSDTRAASSDPAFLAMLELYDGMGAQIVTAVRRDGRLLGMISLHQLGGPRDWSEAEATLAREGAELVARMIAEPPIPAAPTAQDRP
jgi:GAF domain-containing protein